MSKVNPQVHKLIAHFGGQQEVADAIGVSKPTVSNWLNMKHGICALNAMRIEMVTKKQFLAVDLCPDLGEVA